MFHLKTTRFSSKKFRTAGCTTKAADYGTTIPFKIIVIRQLCSSRNILHSKNPNSHFSQCIPFSCFTIWLATGIQILESNSVQHPTFAHKKYMEINGKVDGTKMEPCMMLLPVLVVYQQNKEVSHVNWTLCQGIME